MSWLKMSADERALFNPAFTSVVVWHAATGYYSARDQLLSLPLAFLILPMVLPTEVRNALPRSRSTSLATWLSDNSLVRSDIARHAHALESTTKEALVFGGTHRLYELGKSGIAPRADFEQAIRDNLRTGSQEIISCVRRAEFVGRWFGAAGSEDTVLELVGVKP